MWFSCIEFKDHAVISLKETHRLSATLKCTFLILWKPPCGTLMIDSPYSLFSNDIVLQEMMNGNVWCLSHVVITSRNTAGLSTAFLLQHCNDSGVRHVCMCVANGMNKKRRRRSELETTFTRQRALIRYTKRMNRHGVKHT